MKAIKVRTKKPRSQYVALDAKGKVVAEGMMLSATITRANKVCDEFSLMFVGKKRPMFYRFGGKFTGVKNNFEKNLKFEKTVV